MNVFDIPKGNGKTRRIYCPSVAERGKLSGQVPVYASIAKTLDVHAVQHGFTEGRSSVTNALEHVGFKFTVSFDLESFFDTVTLDKVLPGVANIWFGQDRSNPRFAQEIADRLSRIELECFYDGAARQGLPTSPSLANIAAVPMDNEIMAKNNAGRFDVRPFRYSRYADDLTFSTNSYATVQWLLQEIPKLVEKHGFKINPGKTKVQAAKAGMRIITGVAVSDTGIVPTREVKRRLRAALHQKENGLRRRGVHRLLRNRKKWKKNFPLRFRLHRQVDGLKEWVKLRRPSKAYQRSASVPKATAANVTLGKPVQVERLQTVGPYMRKL